MISDLIRQRLTIKDTESDEEEEGGEDEDTGPGTLIIPEAHDGIFIDFSRYVRHRELRRIWRTNGWSREVSRTILEKTLKDYLITDSEALNALEEFLEHALPIPSEEERSSTSNDEAIGIEQVNKAFPKQSCSVRAGDWILHQVHSESHLHIHL